jgi:hypothetical protein
MRAIPARARVLRRGPAGDGSFAVAAAGRLFILSRAGVLRPFARGPGGYSTALGPEPYIAVAGNDRVAGTGCSFRSGMIFALQPGGRPGIILIGADGRARRFASLPGTVTPGTRLQDQRAPAGRPERRLP